MPKPVDSTTYVCRIAGDKEGEIQMEATERIVQLEGQLVEARTELDRLLELIERLESNIDMYNSLIVFAQEAREWLAANPEADARGERNDQ